MDSFIFIPVFKYFITVNYFFHHIFPNFQYGILHPNIMSPNHTMHASMYIDRINYI